MSMLSSKSHPPVRTHQSWYSGWLEAILAMIFPDRGLCCLHIPVGGRSLMISWSLPNTCCQNALMYWHFCPQEQWQHDPLTLQGPLPASWTPLKASEAGSSWHCDVDSELPGWVIAMILLSSSELWSSSALSGGLALPTDDTALWMIGDEVLLGPLAVEPSLLKTRVSPWVLVL